jgi:DNA-binding IclR family transcriptional regulator
MIQSVIRAIEILETIHKQKDGEAGLVEIAKTLGLDKSTVHNLAKTLKAKNFIEQDGQGGKYKLGKKLLELARGALDDDYLKSLVEPLCMELSSKTGEAVSFCAYRNGAVKAVCRILSESAVIVKPNKRKPIYTTASGRCILTGLSDEELENIIKINGMPEKDWDNISDIKTLKSELDKIKKNKISIAVSNEREAAAVGSVIDANESFGPLSLAVFLPLYRFNASKKKELEKLVKEYSRKISTVLNQI